MSPTLKRTSAAQCSRASSTSSVESCAPRGSTEQLLKFRSPATAITFDSSTNRTAKRLHDPILSSRAFAIFFIVTILIALLLNLT